MTRDYAHRLGGLAGFLALVLAVGLGVWWVAMGSALDQLERRGRADLVLAADRLTGDLQRFREIGVLTADRPGVDAVLSGTAYGTSPVILLREVADKTGALDILIVNSDGRELGAASDTDIVNHAAKPYFERAMDGALGVYHLLSERYGRRVFIFAAPVFSTGGPVSGAVLVVVDVEELEASWRGDLPAIFFRDDLGVVFSANRSELVFLSRNVALLEASQSGEYPTGVLQPFVEYDNRPAFGMNIWTLDAGRYLPEEALHLELAMPVVGLVGEALLDIAPARQLAALQSAVAAAICLVFGMVLFGATERRRTLALANAALEARVEKRTAELEAANLSLRREVAERVVAEDQLKKAQADLVQADKLSALGQMSAGISHELNQPLMAIRSFAENAEAFLERGRTDVAAQNLSRISDLARRMGRIIRNLRAFARQESEPITDVDLVQVVESTLEMAAGRIAQSGVTLHWNAPAAPVMARGGEVRLQQVVLNLITNGIDAMEGSDRRELSIAVASVPAKGAAAPRAEVTVRDTGPGITEPEKIFDPFYSTKVVGAAEGMGLGLSISYGLVQSFGGQIKGRNHPDGGAAFVVELELSAVEVAA